MKKLIFVLCILFLVFIVLSCIDHSPVYKITYYVTGTATKPVDILWEWPRKAELFVSNTELPWKQEIYLDSNFLPILKLTAYNNDDTPITSTILTSIYEDDKLVATLKSSNSVVNVSYQKK